MNPNNNSRSHVLLTLGVLFSLGGAARFLPTNLAAAEEAAPLQHAETQEQVEAGSTPVPAADTPPPDQVCFTGETAAMLTEDQWLFEAEEEELREQKLSLQAWQEELDRDTAELQALQQTLETRWRQMQDTSDKDIEHLAQMYRAMKPDQAASIFNQMDPGFAAGFLRLMPSEQAGLIMARMQTSKAYVVSVKLATMNNDIRNASGAYRQSG